MSANPRLIVVGGDAAGMSAASQAKRVNPDLDVIVYEMGPHVSYGACGIPYVISGDIPDWESLLVMSPEQFRERGIEVRTEHEVVGVQPASRGVAVRDRRGGGAIQDRYDYLVLATGGRATTPPIDGLEADGVFTLRSLTDGMAVKDAMGRIGSRRAAVIGTGFIGLEMADALIAGGVQVTLVGRSSRLMSSFDAKWMGPVLEDLEARGCRVLLETHVEEIGAEGGCVTRVVTDRESIEAEMVVVAVGLAPNVSLAKEAGLALGTTGAISVTDRMVTDASGVYAAGDCVEVLHVVTGEQVFAPLALTANRTGRIAGDNIGAHSLGKVSRQRFRGTAGTMVTKIGGFTAAQTGLDRRGAYAAGFDAVVFERQGRSRAGYYPGGTPIWTKIVVDRTTRRLLGAQMLGREGVAGRIDVFASALFARMTVDDVYNLDLAYAPPYGPVYDPVIEICGRAGIELG